MEDSWENWLSHLGVNGNGATTITSSMVSNLSFEDMEKIFQGQYCDSFNAAGTKQEQSYLRTNQEELGGWCSPTLMTSKRVHESEPREGRGTKKARTSSETQHHIMSERKRRKEISEKFIALSATIPGLKKIDKASILQEAINYVRQLQERIEELEKESEKRSIKTLVITKSSLCSEKCESNAKGYDEANEVIPDVEVRCLEKEVYIRIHCEKGKGVTFKLMNLLKDINLSIASCSILPFGNSFLNIIITGQMSEEYTMTVKDLVKKLKQDLFEVV